MYQFRVRHPLTALPPRTWYYSIQRFLTMNVTTILDNFDQGGRTFMEVTAALKEYYFQQKHKFLKLYDEKQELLELDKHTQHEDNKVGEAVIMQGVKNRKGRSERTITAATGTDTQTETQTETATKKLKKSDSYASSVSSESIPINPPGFQDLNLLIYQLNPVTELSSIIDLVKQSDEALSKLFSPQYWRKINDYFTFIYRRRSYNLASTLKGWSNIEFTYLQTKNTASPAPSLSNTTSSNNIVEYDPELVDQYDWVFMGEKFYNIETKVFENEHPFGSYADD
ncbi:hypothetical protein BDF21DRAFT_405119 [Thamnidium elegans]|nr:hypothetical protein BDF21DRAFT_405119 [Thamnidium elegans]